MIKDMNLTAAKLDKKEICKGLSIKRHKEEQDF